MTIEELQKKKRDLENQICEMLYNFERETKMDIIEVEYITNAFETHASYNVHITLQI